MLLLLLLLHGCFRVRWMSPSSRSPKIPPFFLALVLVVVRGSVFFCLDAFLVGVSALDCLTPDHLSSCVRVFRVCACVARVAGFLFVRNPDKYRSVSAFSAICNPVECPWGKKAFSGYLGEDEASWKVRVPAASVFLSTKSPTYVQGHRGWEFATTGAVARFYYALRGVF